MFDRYCCCCCVCRSCVPIVRAVSPALGRPFRVVRSGFVIRDIYISTHPFANAVHGTPFNSVLLRRRGGSSCYFRKTPNLRAFPRPTDDFHPLKSCRRHPLSSTYLCCYPSISFPRHPDYKPSRVVVGLNLIVDGWVVGVSFFRLWWIVVRWWEG